MRAAQTILNAGIATSGPEAVEAATQLRAVDYSFLRPSQRLAILSALSAMAAYSEVLREHINVRLDGFAARVAATMGVRTSTTAGAHMAAPDEGDEDVVASFSDDRTGSNVDTWSGWVERHR